MPDADERLLLQVVDAGSLKGAAARAGTSASSVSRRIARLEARLGVKLLNRSTVRSTPTEAGAVFVEGIRRLVAEQLALEAEVGGRADTPRGLLRVTAPVGFGARFVVPVLATLQAEAPDLEVDMVLGSGFADLRAQGIDVAVRIGRMPDSALIARRLGAVPRVLVAAPGAFPLPAAPRDLEALPMVLYRRGDGTAQFDVTAPDGTVTAVTLRGRIAVNSMAGIVRLVEAGRGVTYGPLWAFEDALAAGRVVRLLPDHGLRAYPVHAVYPPTLYVPAKVRVFVARMRARVAGEPSLAER